mmetsp:Transcript_17961/g.61225  ORF Transcript_17961/g.61225 Transcript_17961/m.61225 type:complete len:371 (-) Transcript_17961:887-1999(-)
MQRNFLVIYVCNALESICFIVFSFIHALFLYVCRKNILNKKHLTHYEGVPETRKASEYGEFGVEIHKIVLEQDHVAKKSILQNLARKGGYCCIPMFKCSPAALRSVEKAVEDILNVSSREGLSGYEADEYAAHQGRRIARDIDVLCSEFSTGANIVEIGCIPPLFTVAAKLNGYTVTGFDVNDKKLIDILNSEFKLNITQLNTETSRLPVHDESVDGVFMMEVLEHFRINILRSLVDVVRVLKPGGKLFISTPNALSAKAWMNMLATGHCGFCYSQGDILEPYKHLWYGGWAGHIREYTPYEVCNSLERLGMKIEYTQYRGPIGPPAPASLVTLFPSYFGKYADFFLVCASKQMDENSLGKRAQWAGNEY